MNRNKFLHKVLIVILILLFSSMLGIFLESLRFHIVGYYRVTKFDVPRPTELVMSIHSSSKDFFPKYHTFLHIMLIPCILIICFDYKLFFTPKGTAKLTLHCLVVMMLNLTIAGFITLMMIDPIYRVELLPNGEHQSSIISLTITWLTAFLFILSIILLFRMLFIKRYRSMQK